MVSPLPDSTKWLTDNGIPFAEHDVEADANARALLVQMGKEQGIPEHMLSSVPILAVNGKLILGFNEGEVRRMLGK
jgi:arsenate reductase-like glutaredoxin family protein